MNDLAYHVLKHDAEAYMTYRVSIRHVCLCIVLIFREVVANLSDASLD